LNVLSSIRRAFGLLSRRDQWILSALSGAQVATAFLDLAGVLLLGMVAALAAANATGGALNVGGLSTIVGDLPTSSSFILYLAFGAAMLLVSKSVISLYITRRAFQFIANRQAMIAGAIAARLLNRPLLEVQTKASQEVTLALTSGVNALTINTLGPAVVIVAEFSLVGALFIGLIFVDPVVAVFTLVFFGALALILQLLLGSWAQKLGRRQADADIGSMVSVQHALRTYREVTVTGRRRLFISRFQGMRWEAARVQADAFILNQIGKYVFEIGLIIGGGLLVLFMAATQSVTAAVAIVTVFLATSSRIFPSLLRLQTSMSTIRNSEGTSHYTYSLIDALNEGEKNYSTKHSLESSVEALTDSIFSGFPGFQASVCVTDVSLNYPGASDAALSSVSIEISTGQSVALVGMTGAGKSTLADVILGVLVPDSGSVTISGVAPYEAVRKWPGAMAYVPQDVAVLTGTVRENVALGIPPDSIDDNLVWEALKRAQLSTFLANSREGIDTLVGENGVQLSGGQRQRLGIARALYSRPRLLVLDEATSALDSETENTITQTLDSLAGDVTLIVIAHRLATVRHSDQVIYLENGRIMGSGTFDEVRAAVPNFDKQASLLGF
jgi:ABC-type multidrug transport system fused ATPase/permease subunit